MAVSLPVAMSEMRAADIPAVHEIERLSFNAPWPPYAFEQELANNRLAHYIVARSDERIVGFAGIWMMADEAHVTTFGVHPDTRRQGIGMRMMLALLELSLELHAARMTLEVRVSNEAAQALYRRFGFVMVGRRKRYYTDDGEDALIMSTSELDGPSMQTLLMVEQARLAPRPAETQA
jgi:[ribosomal protein S18]-alanine N-acetyltransferase